LVWLFLCYALITNPILLILLSRMIQAFPQVKLLFSVKVSILATTIVSWPPLLS
jgi:hypothetical protein